MGRIRLRPGRQRSLLAGRPWVYRNEIGEVEGDPATGDVIVVADARGRYVATAFYHRTSMLAARVLSRREGEEVGTDFFRQRLLAAWALRSRFLDDVSACRVVFAEADGLPGLIVDRFDRVLVVQTLTAGMDARLDMVLDTLTAMTGITDVYERNDGPVRRLEGLPERRGPLRGHPPDRVDVREGAVRLTVDLARGQKTGHFLDQRDNRLAFGRAVRRLLVEPALDGAAVPPPPPRDPGGPAAAAPPGACAGPPAVPPPPARAVRVLDAFCNTGGFGLHALAAGAGEVWFVDSSEAAVEAALEHAERNGFGGRAVGRVGNAFDELRSLEAEPRSWDAIVLDPPAFARGRAQLDGAFRGYKDLNLRAMRLLAPGGLLCTCSCSQPVTWEMFSAMLAEAAADTGRSMRVLERRGAPADHPGLLGAEETQYLQCHLLQAVD